MNPTEITMQAEEVEEAVSCIETTPPLCDMTFSNSRGPTSPTIKHEPSPDDAKFGSESITKFDGINLEDDIEKVEVTSLESSDNLEDLTTELPKEILDKSTFKGISEQHPNESIKSWLQRITDIQQDINKKFTAVNSNHSLNNGVIASGTANRVVKYQDLPYMGEMTLDNSKPRRGRKPKKADICHLIYKNYGTIFPGTPNPNSYLERENGAVGKKPVVVDAKESTDNLNRSDVQNRIISSLLEKRLTQEYKRSKELEKGNKEKKDQSEPLNLCIRDLNHLKIRLLKKNDNTYTSEIKSEPQSDDDVEIVRDAIPTIFKNDNSTIPPVIPESLNFSSPDSTKTPESSAPGGYVYWPNAGVFIHPMALQQQLMMYQRLSNNNSYTLPSNSPRPPPEERKKPDHPELRKLVPKVRPKRPETAEETEPSPPHDNKTKRNSTTPAEKTPTKRKRSAIFIPPIPTENTANPATEVSICKFKFTGGAKPSLQEKKMLSVDSGGNFRYYSGTGDKSMRGYEFFPRETLQQQINNTQGSSTGAFLQASGEKIYPVPPLECSGTKTGSDFLLSPDLPATSLTAVEDPNSRHKKRKSRKSLQREKLEQTFKEKGFLIQTQQLESAEGATYCKFRQLRKFTRYLFRSWKDYLPGNVRELQEGERMDASDLTVDPDNIDNLSVNSSELSSSNIQ